MDKKEESRLFDLVAKTTDAVLRVEKRVIEMKELHLKTEQKKIEIKLKDK